MAYMHKLVVSETVLHHIHPLVDPLNVAFHIAQRRIPTVERRYIDASGACTNALLSIVVSRPVANTVLNGGKNELQATQRASHILLNREVP
jgi:hypothetical protein